MKFSKWTIPRVLALVLVVAGTWCLNWDRTTVQNWAVPIDYFEDTPMELGWIKAASEGDFVPVLSKRVTRLGAPYLGNWNDWPGAWGEFSMSLAGLLARGVGFFQAANLMVLLAFVANAAGFYACCRLMRFRWDWSFVGAVLFAFTYFNTFQGLHHLIATFEITLPLIVLTSWLVGFGKRLRWGHWTGWLCLATAVVTGMSNPYNLNIFGQLLCLALLFQLLTRRRKVNLQLGFVALAIAGFCFLIMNLDTLTYQWAHGKNELAVPRGYYEFELFALKPMELVVPPPDHRVTAMAVIGSRYLNLAWLRGEVFEPYLGIVTVGALAWMVAEVFVLIARMRQFPRRLPAYGAQGLWILCYSVVGGLNCLIALAGLMLFRGTNRFSIFISTLALLFLVSRLSVLSRRWQPATRIAACGAILLVGLLDEVPQATTPEETKAIARVVEADRAFAGSMEEQLPPRAMVFELPVMRYPEAAPVNNLGNYELLRPYLHSRTLRFSFGSDYGRPRDDWQKEVEKLPPPDMVKALERCGFAAIYLNRKGFPDRAEALIKQLIACGKSRMIEDTLREQVCIFLNPSPHPEMPPASNRPLIVHHGGWLTGSDTPEGHQDWTSGNASLSVFNESKDYSTCSVSCRVGSLVPRRVSLVVNGAELWSAQLGSNQVAPLQVTFEAKPRYNKVEFKTDYVERPSKHTPVPRGFVLINLQIAWVSTGPK